MAHSLTIGCAAASGRRPCRPLPQTPTEVCLPGSARFHLLPAGSACTRLLPPVLSTNSGSINWTSRILRIRKSFLRIDGQALPASLGEALEWRIA